MFRRIYLDNSATTPVDPAVIDAMLPYLGENFGNASSIHYFGQQARAAVDKARFQIAALINAKPNEIVFTSGGTEANNLAIRGLFESLFRSRSLENAETPHLITSTIEHPAVLNVCEDLEKRGCDVTYLPIGESGVVRTKDIEDAITKRTFLISVMTVNNEIGTIQPVEEIGRLIRKLREDRRKIWFHTDAVQAAGKLPVDVEEIGCDLLSLSAHKIYAPKGIGALYVRRGVRLRAQTLGGRQERSLRGGTEPVAQIVAFGKAADLAGERLATLSTQLQRLRDRFEDKIFESIPDVHRNGDRAGRVANISNLSFGSIEGEALLINLDMKGIAVSTGAACSSGSLEPSPVIRAIGRTDELARGAIRFSFGKDNTEADLDRVVDILPKAVSELRRLTASAK